MKVELVTDRRGTPIGVATDAAGVPETALAGAALASIPAAAQAPHGAPVIADRAYDSDPLREELAACGYRLLAPHRKNRQRRSNDGRRLRRYRRRWIVERTFAWLHSYRRVLTRFERNVNLYDGFVYLACAFIALGRL
jgi:IS5 family transposase